MAVPALSDQDKTTLLAMLAKFNGDPNAFMQAALQAYGDTLKTDTIAALSGISLTVNNWTQVPAVVAAGDSRSIPSIMADLTTALNANSTANVGPLLIALYAAVKKHFGL